MMSKPNTIAIEIMAGKQKNSDEGMETSEHMAVCPKCGHEFMMGEESEDEESEDESEKY
jgi:uncharacterized Zn ribbon protein